MSRFFKANVTTTITMWALGCVALIISWLGFGGGYAFGGPASVYTLEPFKYIDIIPGGLTMHGVIMCVLALGLLWAIAGIVQSKGFADRSWVIAKVSLVGVTFYSAWCTYAFAAAWISNHHYLGITWFFLASLISAGTLLASIHMVRTTSAIQTISSLEAAAKATIKAGSDDARTTRGL